MLEWNLARKIKRITDMSGFQLSRLPFYYLGVPITPKKLSTDEGRILTEKMTPKIRQWSTKNLSYAGRVVLINSVLMAIQSYWSQIIILPNKIIKEINNICKAFLWKSREDFSGPGAVAWEKLCQPKRCGGLGFRNLSLWNKAACFKHVWAID